MKASDRYAIYLKAADSAFDGKDVSEFVNGLNDEEKELFDSTYELYKSRADRGEPCPIIEIPYDYGEDD